MLTDRLSVSSLAIAEAVDPTLASIDERLVTDSDSQPALATQLDLAAMMPSVTSVIATQMDWRAEMQSMALSLASAMDLTSPSRSYAACDGTGLTNFLDLQPSPAVLEMAGFSALLPPTTLDDLLSALSLQHSEMASGPSTPHDLLFPLDAALQQFATVGQPPWTLDPTEVFGMDLVDQHDEILFRPGTILGALHALLRPIKDPTLVEEAIGDLADGIPWRIRSRQVWQAIVARAKAEQTSVRAIQHRELCAALLLVLETRDQPQALRLGRSWLTADDGSKDSVAPQELPLHLPRGDQRLA